MTPQEKAQELVEKFTFICRECDYIDNAKQCALIAVDEILVNNCGSFMYESEIAQNYEIYCDEYYWQDVKDEIKKL